MHLSSNGIDRCRPHSAQHRPSAGGNTPPAGRPAPPATRALAAIPAPPATPPPSCPSRSRERGPASPPRSRTGARGSHTSEETSWTPPTRARQTAATGPPGTARTGSHPRTTQEALPSCAAPAAITRSGTLFDQTSPLIGKRMASQAILVRQGAWRQGLCKFPSSSNPSEVGRRRGTSTSPRARRVPRRSTPPPPEHRPLHGARCRSTRRANAADSEDCQCPPGRLWRLPARPRARGTDRTPSAATGVEARAAPV